MLNLRPEEIDYIRGEARRERCTRMPQGPLLCTRGDPEPAPKITKQSASEGATVDLGRVGMSNTHIEFSASSATLIEKCCRAVEQNTVAASGLTRDDFHQALTEAAEAWQQKTSKPFPVCFDEVTRTRAGSLLYTGYVSAPAGPPPVAKQVKFVTDAPGQAANELDRLASEREMRTGENFYEAYAKVLETDRGRELYSQSRGYL